MKVEVGGVRPAPRVGHSMVALSSAAGNRELYVFGGRGEDDEVILLPVDVLI